MNCTKCELYDKGCTTVCVPPREPVGIPRIMLVLDYPDKTDNRFGRTLSTDAYKKLAFLCSVTGLDIDEIYVTYAVKCMPPAKKVKKQNYEACRDAYLIREIVKYRPEIIITSGSTALQSLTGDHSVFDFRGFFRDFSVNYNKRVGDEVRQLTFRTKIMPTYSLHASLWEWTHDIYIRHDFEKVRLALKTKNFPAPIVPSFTSVDTSLKLKDFYHYMMDTKIDYCATDFETTGFDFWRHRIINSGYCLPDNQIFVVPQLQYLDKKFFKNWTKDQLERAREINSFVSKNKDNIQKVLSRIHGKEEIKWILHNGKFDLKFARSHKIPFKTFYFDTMLADSLIDENRSHSLNVVAEYYGFDFGPYDTALWPYIGKNEDTKKSYQHAPIQMLEQYLAIDTLATKKIFEKQVKMLKKEELWDHFIDLKMVSLKQITDSEFKGVKVSRDFLIESQNKMLEEISNIEKRCRELAGDEKFNLASPKQILEYFKKIKVPFDKLDIKKTKTGYSTDKENLNKIMKIEKFKEMPELLLRYAAMTKITGTYLCGDHNKKDIGGLLQYLDKNDRIHTNYNLHTAVTSRQSSNSPSLQVWPRPVKGLPNVRSCLIPSSPDHVFFEADYSQLEQCVVAFLSGDKLLLERIRSGMDLHCLNAIDLGRKLKTIDPSITYEYIMTAIGKGADVGNVIDGESITKEMKDLLKEVRNRAKAISFGLNYGKMADSFAEEFGISKEEAHKMVNAYFGSYSGMYNWRNELVEEAFTNGCIKLQSGRKRRFYQVVEWLQSPFSKDVFSAKIIKNEIIRQIYNFPVQGGAHEVFEPQYVNVTKEYREERLSSILLLYIHDGLVGECHKDDMEKTRKILQDKLPITLGKGTKNELKLKVDIDFYEVGACWYGPKLE